MSEIPKYDSEGNYHDDDIRIEAYAETADIPKDIDPILVDTVIKQLSNELAPVIKDNPAITVNEIKIQAMHRFMDLLEKKLLTQREADRCYQRFVQMVSFYYGTP
jgi:hypothetical protein